MILERLLAAHYHLSGATVTPAARGFVAETFTIEHPSGRYFAKIVPLSRYSANFESSLPLLADLASLGITQIPQVIPTVNGTYSVRSGNRILALFRFIAAEATIDYDFEQYVTLIAKIHGKTQALAAKPPRDTFALPFAGSLNDQVKAVLSLSPADECERRLQEIVTEIAAELAEDLPRAQQWGERLRASNDIEFVITHGDAPGNVLQDASGEIYLIDWDDLLLAPRERDTWFHLRESVQKINAYHRDARTFLGYYRRTCPGYEINHLALNYYLYWRYLDDLEGFLSRIIEPGQALEKKQQYLALLEKDCLTWLRPWVREH